MQHYLLSEIGDECKGEVGTEGFRRGALELLESQLAALIKSSDGIRKLQNSGPAVASPTAGKGFVSSLKSFHEGQISNVGALEKANLALIRHRQWLHRMNAALTPAGKIIWPKSVATVVYDDEVKKEFTKLSIEGGIFRTHDRKLLDTRKMVTALSGPGYGIYVMSAEGHFHVSSHSVGFRHHSSLLGGRPVANAGELRVVDGRLEYLSNKSGHYQPDLFHFLQTIYELKEQGVDYGYRVTHQTAHGSWSYPDPYSFAMANYLDNVNYEWQRVLFKYANTLTPEFYAANKLIYVTGDSKDAILPGFCCMVDLSKSQGFTYYMNVAEFDALMQSKGATPSYAYKTGTGR